jgi:hypothetical protein
MGMILMSLIRKAEYTNDARNDLRRIDWKFIKIGIKKEPALKSEGG